MSISLINAQGGYQIPGSSLNRSDGKSLEDASSSRAQGAQAASGGTVIDKKAAMLGTQKSEVLRDERQLENAQEPDEKTLTDAVEKVKRFVQSAASDVSFSVDDESGIRVVKVVDKETKEIIRQMPSKEVVELAKALDKLQGLMIRQTA